MNTAQVGWSAWSLQSVAPWKCQPPCWRTRRRPAGRPLRQTHEYPRAKGTSGWDSAYVVLGTNPAAGCSELAKPYQLCWIKYTSRVWGGVKAYAGDMRVTCG